VNPKNAETYQNRGNSWFSKRDFENAAADYGDAIRLDPKNAANYYNRANTWTQKGDNAKAIADFDDAIKLNPKYADAYLNRAIALVNTGEIEKGLADYDELIRLTPQSSPAYNSRGWAYSKHGDFAKALEGYNESIRIDPSNTFAITNRALLLATCSDAKIRDGDKAVADATKLCELSNWKSDSPLETLAIALAEAGKFDDAVKRLQAAIDLNPVFNRAFRDIAMEDFKAKKPYHEQAVAAAPKEDSK
jgi:tetratricopeptide (TPR) repeat protein